MIAGIPIHELGEWTQGEIEAVIRANRARERRRDQNLSIIAHRHAILIAGLVTGHPATEVYNHFPFWTEEETTEMQVQKYKNIMQRHAAQGVKKRG